MKSKTCKQCDNKVDINTKYCPHCGGNEFITESTELVPRQANPTIIHRLFYWNYNGYYMLSKSKLLGMGVFLLILSAATPALFASTVLVALILALIVFLIGFAIHLFISHPRKAKLKHNDYGLIRDFINLMLFWQNKNTGEYVLSKTKIISHIIFILFAALAATFSPPNLFAVLLMGFVLEVPAFAIGYAVHKLTNPNPVNPPKQVSKPKEIPKPKPEPEAEPVIEDVEGIVHEFAGYKVKIQELSKQYDLKEKQTRELIEKRFAPPQLTYTRFISVVDKSTELFKKQSSSALTMIDIAGEYSEKIESEIMSKIEMLTMIIGKLEDLTNELVLSMDDSNDEEINNLFDDMSNLIHSVKDYE